MPKYKHVSQRDQILLRPGQHIGSAKLTKQEKWVAEKDSQIVKKDIIFSPGLVHIFYEVLSNAQDNYFRSVKSKTPLKKIEITIEDDTLSVWNDGLHIPVRKHEWQDDEENLGEDYYEPEIIFGHLNSSSNYDDTNEERVGAGLHGVGVKLTNIFSKEFTIECYDPDSNQKFVQKFLDNMSKRSKPKITQLKRTTGYTKISYKADFARFGVEGYNKTFHEIVRKMCIDCSMITNTKIIFNKEVFNIKNVKDYSKFYNFSEDLNTIELKSKDSQVILIEKEGEKRFQQISFVNGVNTDQGGIHVDTWAKAIAKPLLEKIKKKYTKGKNSSPIKLSLKSLLDYFSIFVVCNLPNPEFLGQTKNVLSSPAPTVQIPESKINNLMKWDFLKSVEDIIKLQNMKELKKTDGKKSNTINIQDIDDANEAGKSKSKDCTLFITEGLSAKAFAVQGISAIEKGRDFYGIMPVKGKVMNVRKASAAQINANKEITNLKKVLGLQHGLDYNLDKNFDTLRYGKVNILTDADVDGDHIKGLILNFFEVFYPSLVERGYIQSLRTPIVIASIGKKKFTFYYSNDYKKWAKENPNHKADYYKGLGSSSDAEILEIFKNPKDTVFIADDSHTESVDLAFNGNRQNDRKVWLGNYIPAEMTYPEVNGIEQVSISDFINNDLIEFSIYDCQRSIPNIIDGLKTSQRKVIHVALNTLNTKDKYKVTQFANEVANKSKYHHGENSLVETVIGLAQTFVGSNNIALLAAKGQFGTRIAGGKDASSGRYLHTYLSSIIRNIFRKEDDPVLKYLMEDGQKIEPKYFVPIIPMLLVNGANGIGTAYSTNIPMYNPLDLVKWIKLWLEDSEEFPELVPWYRNFTGEIQQKDKDLFYTGTVTEEKGGYRITELPIGVWTQNYKDGKLAKLRESKDITRLTEHSSAFKVDIKVFTTKKLDTKKLGLETKGKLTNLTGFTSKLNLKTYKSIVEILNEFCEVRFMYYQKRKKYLLRDLNTKLQEINTKVNFIKKVLKDVSILKRDEEDLFMEFERLGYYKREDSYRYLTDIPVRNFTKDKLELLKKQVTSIESEIDYVTNKTPKEMWLSELDELLVSYNKWLTEVEKTQKEIEKTKIKRK